VLLQQRAEILLARPIKNFSGLFFQKKVNITRAFEPWVFAKYTELFVAFKKNHYCGNGWRVSLNCFFSITSMFHPKLNLNAKHTEFLAAFQKN